MEFGHATFQWSDSIDARTRIAGYFFARSSSDSTIAGEAL
jgi:hypothetical protein